jgi:hypothetical protein
MWAYQAHCEGREEMTWFWLRRCRHRRVTSAGGLAHDSAGQPAGRKAARRIGSAWLSVVLAAAAAGCTGPPGSTGRGQAATAASPSLFISKTAPGTPVGRQLTWFFRAVGQLPWPRQVVQAHFSSGIVRGGVDGLNSGLEQVLAAEGASASPSGASLTGLLWQDPARDPVSLLAVADFGGVKLMATIAVDRAGRISELLLRPYQPSPASWAQVDRELAGLAPGASFLAARVSPGGRCTPVHQVAASTARPLASMFKVFVLARSRTRSPRAGSPGTRS